MSIFEAAAGIEVNEPGRVVFFYYNMFGFDIPVDNAKCMKPGKTMADGQQELAGFFFGKIFLCLQSVSQTLAVDVFFDGDGFFIMVDDIVDFGEQGDGCCFQFLQGKAVGLAAFENGQRSLLIGHEPDFAAG